MIIVQMITIVQIIMLNDKKKICLCFLFEHYTIFVFFIINIRDWNLLVCFGD